MKKVVVTCILSAMMSLWAFDVIVPVESDVNSEEIVVTGDPLPHDVWDD